VSTKKISPIGPAVWPAIGNKKDTGIRKSEFVAKTQFLLEVYFILSKDGKKTNIVFFL